jgi:hypothetical protein
MKIRRFPRLLKDYPDAPLTRSMRERMRDEKIVPRGYDKLTRRQMKLARKVVNGMTVKDACKTMGMDTNTFYRYMHYHKLFKNYYLHYAAKYAENIDGRLDAKAGRAIRIVEEAMDSPDDYLRYNVAEKFLAGRGFYKKNVESKQQISGAVKMHGSVKHLHKPMDQEIMVAFVEAFRNMAGGGKEVQPKIVKGKTVSKVINALPAPAPNADNSEVQEVDQEKAS